MVETARAMGLDWAPLKMARPGAVLRAAWNAARVLRGRRPGGFQYSPLFLERLWRRDAARVRGHAVLNCYQLYPASLASERAVERWFYIDATLRQLFGHYGTSASPAMQAAALEAEFAGYAQARGVICHSEWAARSVREDYGIDPARVHVVVPGANILPAALAGWQPPPLPTDGPLRLVFVGMDGRRKGLDRLLAAMPLAREQGAAVSLRVIGCGPEAVPPELRAVEGAEWLGRIDKRGAAARFLDLVGGCEIGCLLSRAEMGGMVLREYAALGLGAIAPDVGGAPEHCAPGAAALVSPEASAQEIAALLARLATRGDDYRAMRAAALAGRDAARWDASLARIAAIIGAA